MKQKASIQTVVLAIAAFLTFAFVAVYSFDVSWQFLLHALGYCLLALAIIVLPASLLGWLIVQLRRKD